MIAIPYSRQATTAFVSICLAACQTIDSEPDTAARITNPGPASRAELQKIVNIALGTEALLAEDALVSSSVLSIEHNPPASIAVPDAQGRDMGMPVKFQLVIDGSDCVLVDLRDKARYKLQDTTCEAEE